MNATTVVALSNGLKAELRPATGRDLERAAMIAGGMNNPLSLMMAVVAQVGVVDGKPLIYEELQAMPMNDVLALVGAASGNAEGEPPASVTSS